MGRQHKEIGSRLEYNLITGGAGQQVTGSFHVIEQVQDQCRRLLILDCGMMQERPVDSEVSDKIPEGGKESKNQWLFRKNFIDVPVLTSSHPPRKEDILPIKAVDIVVTHAHFDHCARLPQLVKHLREQYHDCVIRVITTKETAQLLPIALLDTFHIQQKDVERYQLNQKEKQSGGKENKKGRRDQHTGKKVQGKPESQKSNVLFCDESDIEELFCFDSDVGHSGKIRKPVRVFSSLQEKIKSLLNPSYGDDNEYMVKIQTLQQSIQKLIDVQHNDHQIYISFDTLSEIMRELKACLEAFAKNISRDIPYRKLQSLLSSITKQMEIKEEFKGEDRKVLKMVTPDYHEIIRSISDVRLKLLNAGHILGSASVVVEIDTKNGPKRLVYTGDLGSRKSETAMPLIGKPESVRDLNGFEKNMPVDVLITETTYGGRKREKQLEQLMKMKVEIIKTLDRGGNIVVPSFALERSQDFLFYIKSLLDQINQEREDRGENMRSLLTLWDQLIDKLGDVGNNLAIIRDQLFHKKISTVSEEVHITGKTLAESLQAIPGLLQTIPKSTVKEVSISSQKKMLSEVTETVLKSISDSMLVLPDNAAELEQIKNEVAEEYAKYMSVKDDNKKVSAMQRYSDYLKQRLQKMFIYKKRFKPVKVFMDSPLQNKFSAVYSKKIESDFMQQMGNVQGGDRAMAKAMTEFNTIFRSDIVVRDVVPRPNRSKKGKNGKKRPDAIDPVQQHFNKIHYDNKPCIIVSSAGMGDHGPARTHLEMGIQDSENLILLIGYMAKGTFGRLIKEQYEVRASTIKIGDKILPLLAKVLPIESFSSHADGEDLLHYAMQTAQGNKNGIQIIQVHGEKTSMDDMKRELEKKGINGDNILQPKTGDVTSLSKLFEKRKNS